MQTGPERPAEERDPGRPRVIVEIEGGITTIHLVGTTALALLEMLMPALRQVDRIAWQEELLRWKQVERMREVMGRARHREEQPFVHEKVTP